MISEIAGVKRKLGECQRSREGSAKEVRCSRVAALSFQGVDIGYDSGGGSWLNLTEADTVVSMRCVEVGLHWWCGDRW